MIEFTQLSYLTAIAKCGTISRAAEELHLSQPALSRSMQKLEQELGVTLFQRSKNKLALNANGTLAVECAQKVLDQLTDLEERVRAFDRANRTITLSSCAPAPLWDVLPAFSALYPEMTVSYDLTNTDAAVAALKKGDCQIAILPMPMEEGDFTSIEYESEQLMFSLPEGHAMAGAAGLTMREMDGASMLLFSQLGFWHDLVREKMPAARFLVQTDRAVFTELVSASSLPSFMTDIGIRNGYHPENRVIVPILDEEAKVTYYCVCSKSSRSFFAPLFRWIGKKS